MSIKNFIILVLGQSKIAELSYILEKIDESFSFVVSSIDKEEVKEKIKDKEVENILYQKSLESIINKWLFPKVLLKENAFIQDEECKALIEKRLSVSGGQVFKQGQAEKDIDIVKGPEEIVISPNVSERTLNAKIWLMPSHLDVIKTLFDKGCEIELLDQDGKVVRKLIN